DWSSGLDRLDRLGAPADDEPAGRNRHRKPPPKDPEQYDQYGENDQHGYQQVHYQQDPYAAQPYEQDYYQPAHEQAPQYDKPYQYDQQPYDYRQPAYEDWPAYDSPPNEWQGEPDGYRYNGNGYAQHYEAGPEQWNQANAVYEPIPYEQVGGFEDDVSE